MILFEIIGALIKTIWMLLEALLTTIWTCLPDILQLKVLLGYFTPAGIIGLWLGVPTVIITILGLAIKKFVIGRI